MFRDTSQAKKSIYNTRKHKIEHNLSCNLEAVFFSSVKSRILIDFRYFKATNDLVSIPLICSYRLCVRLLKTTCVSHPF